jgi:hypothetical protein
MVINHLMKKIVSYTFYKAQTDIIAITEVVPKNMRYTLNKAEIELSGYELFPSNFPGLKTKQTKLER